MSAGQGFAKRLTPERLARYAPLLKRRPARAGGQDAEAHDEDAANTVTPPDPAAVQAEADFDGESVRVRLPFPRARGVRPGARRRRRRQTTGNETANTERTAGALEPVWDSKPLTHRDLTIPVGATTNPTGSINLDKGLLPPEIDHRHYFREDVFSRLDWRPKSRAVDQAAARFQLIVRGIDHGEHESTIQHTTSTTTRAYEQRNAMTRLSWGPMSEYVRDPRLIGRTLSIYRDTGDPSRFVLNIH